MCNCRGAFWADLELDNEAKEAFVDEDEYLIHAGALSEYLVAICTAVAVLFRGAMMLWGAPGNLQNGINDRYIW